MKCSNCGFINERGAQFCENCGLPLKKSKKKQKYGL